MLTIGAHHGPNQGQGPHAGVLLVHLRLAEEELHQLLGVGAGCRGKIVSVVPTEPEEGSRQRRAGAQSLTERYEAVHDLHQVLAAVLLLGRGLGAHLGWGAQGR